MNINTTIHLAGPLTPQQTALVDQANTLRERAETIKESLENAPSDKVTLDERNSNERLGIYYFKGKIGNDEFSEANASLKENGQVEAFAAHDPIGKPGTTVKFHTGTSKATGLRAAIAGAFGGIAGGLGGAAAWFLAKAWSTENRVGATLLAGASKPLELGSNLARLAERKIGDPGTRDALYAQSSPNGDYEQYVFTAGGDLEVLKTNIPRT